MAKRKEEDDVDLRETRKGNKAKSARGESRDDESKGRKRSKQTRSSVRDGEGSDTDGEWSRRVNEEIKRQQPVHVKSDREGADAKRKRDQQARSEDGLREGREDEREERERLGFDRRRQQGWGSESRFDNSKVGTGDVQWGRGRQLAAPSPRSSSAKFDGPERGRPGKKFQQSASEPRTSVLNNHNRGVMLNPRPKVTQ